MPVRYDIAAGLAQPQQSYSPMNMLAQMQAMDYREQQNALAQAQLAEYQRKIQAEQARAGLFARPGFNPLTQQGLLDIARVDPEYFRQFISPYASYTSGLASAEATRNEQRLRQREFEEIKLPRADVEKQKLGIETEKLGLEKEEAALRGRKLQQDIRKFEEVEMPKAFSDLEKARNEKKITEQDFLVKKAGFYRDYFKDFVTNQKTLDRLVDLMDQDKDFPAGGEAFRGVKFTPEWKASQLIPPEKQAEMARPEFEYREVTDATGATQIVAIPKRSPQAGAIPVPGAAGVKPPDYSFMPGPPDTGLVTRTNPRTGEAELITPRQPAANIMAPALPPANGMAAPAPARMIPSEIRPTAEAPVGSAAYNNKRFATEVLDAAGFNSETGEDRVSQLIKGSTSGGMQAKAAGVRGFFGGASPGMENIAKLETIKNDVVLKKLAGKLGAGISEGDRQFIEKLMGDIANPEIPANQRLAAWNQVKGMMVKYANTGQTGAAQPGAAAGRPSLDEIFK